MSGEARLREKFTRGVDALVTGLGTIQQRVADAGYHVCSLLHTDVPEDMSEEYEDLNSTLTKVHNASLGSIKATAYSMSDDDAKICASRILLMSQEIWRRGGIESGMRQAQRQIDDAQDLSEIG